MTWHFARADATHLPLADQSVDLTFASPPYMDARTYGIGAQRDCVEWVEWMLPVLAEAQRVTRGPVLIVAAGVTRQRNYWPGCEGLMWEWWKRGGDCQLYRPCFWNRVGIPGSGGKDWFRADVEYVMCFKRPGALAWSDNTACGHSPKWAPGGEMSYRQSNGARVNQWGHSIDTGGTTGSREDVTCGPARPSHQAAGRNKFGGGGTSFGRRANGEKIPPAGRAAFRVNERKANGQRMRVTGGTSETGEQLPNRVTEFPVLSNPGNLISDLRILKTIDILTAYAILKTIDPSSVLRDVRSAIDSCNLQKWWAGVIIRVREAEILQPAMQGSEPATSERTEAGRLATQGKEDRAEDQAESGLRGMRPNESTPCSSQKRGRDRQRDDESRGPLLVVPPEEAQAYRMQRSRMQSAVLREGVLLASLAAMEEIRRSIDEVLESTLAPPESSNLASFIVGGGVMGSDLAHENEAPFCEALAEFFIKSLCPPGGRVLDMFSGSGTTVSVANRLGRTGVGFDLRMSQCELGRRRLLEPVRSDRPKRKRPAPSPAQGVLWQ